jgi:hypothetical protein
MDVRAESAGTLDVDGSDIYLDQQYLASGSLLFGMGGTSSRAASKPCFPIWPRNFELRSFSE